MDAMKDQKGRRAELDDVAERNAIAEMDDELDARSDGEGLGAEAGRGEENGLAEG
jgi:hypothetical protein